MQTKKLISVIVPCYNEEEVLPLFYKEIKRVSAGMQEAHPELEFEYLFIDDGSRDRTLKILRDYARADKHVRYISFSRNFGKESGIYAGLSNAKGDYCVVMDADLQHPPAFLPQMYEAVKSGRYDCATTRRVSRDGESKIRSWFARLFYKIMNKISQTEIVDGAQDFRFMTRQMVDAVLAMGEYNRFSKGIFSWVGFRVKYIEYENVERAVGTTKWSFWSLFRYSIEGIIGFSTAPLQISVVLGLLSCLLAVIIAIVTIIKKLAFGEPVLGYPTLICTMVFFAGLQLFCTGILGTYLSKTYLEVKHRPIYLMRENEQNMDEFPDPPEKSARRDADSAEAMERIAKFREELPVEDSMPEDAEYDEEYDDYGEYEGENEADDEPEETLPEILAKMKAEDAAEETPEAEPVPTVKEQPAPVKPAAPAKKPAPVQSAKPAAKPAPAKPARPAASARPQADDSEPSREPAPPRDYFAGLNLKGHASLEKESEAQVSRTPADELVEEILREKRKPVAAQPVKKAPAAPAKPAPKPQPVPQKPAEPEYTDYEEEDYEEPYEDTAEDGYYDEESYDEQGYYDETPGDDSFTMEKMSGEEESPFMKWVHSIPGKISAIFQSPQSPDDYDSNYDDSDSGEDGYGYEDYDDDGYGDYDDGSDGQ